jgi:hypothetical protein
MRYRLTRYGRLSFTPFVGPGLSGEIVRQLSHVLDKSQALYLFYHGVGNYWYATRIVTKILIK